MDVGLFNPNSQRAQRARMGHQLSPWAPSFEISVALLLVAGIVMLVFGMAAGWALVGLAAVPAMVVEWYKRELHDVPAVKGGERVDDLMDGELLGILPDQPSPADIAAVLNKTTGGLFFAARFGVGGSFLQQVVSQNREDTAAVFQEALAIAKNTIGRISPGVMILALVRQVPAKDTLLGHLQLTEDDLEKGIHWYQRLHDLIEASRSANKKPGGIGRDWSFGYVPTLTRYGRNLSYSFTLHTDIRQEVIDQLVQGLTKGGSMALVGQTGTGKTEVMYELASTLMDPTASVPEKLRYHQVFMLDASRLLAAASGKGQLEILVETILGEAFTAKNIVICLDEAQLFFEEGVGSVDISTLLLPILEAGRLPIILTMDEQKFLQISKRMPALANALNRINLPAASEEQTLRVMQDHVPRLEHKRKVTYMYQALKEAYKLSARYVYDVAMPGQAIGLLDAAAEYAESGLVTARSVGVAIEKITGVKTNRVDDDTERDTLLNMEALIHERMIGQDRAVRVVADALRRARAGIRNQQRPVGTFLFLGPTGVGKTELAKSLAAVYFGGEDKIIRLDMNEFVSSDDVARLIADGADDPGSLTAQVMKQPFSVVLLDEIEKAHSSVLTTLLQLLDEGILRDVRGREISFRDTIVIATSNANAERIQEYIHRGYQLEQFEETFLNELLSSHIFHPEFLNRFDEMVVFRPLEKSELRQVVDLILAGVNRNVAEQKLTIAVADDAKEYLVEAGYDPRLGARPMRRVVQRTVENMVAKKMLEKSVEPGSTIQITLDDVKSLLDKQQQADEIAATGKSR